MPDSSPRKILANDFQRQWQEIRDDALTAVDRVGRSGWLVLGEEVREFEQALESARASDVGGESSLAAYIRLSANDCEDTQPSASWIFSAIAEDPDFLAPIKSFKQQLFQRLKGETPSLKALLICFLAIEGLRSMNLFDSDILSRNERQLLVSSLLEIAK